MIISDPSTGLPSRWRKNGRQLTLRKKIREEARRRLYLNRDDLNAWGVSEWAHRKIRRFYDLAPLSVVWPIPVPIRRQ